MSVTLNEAALKFLLDSEEGPVAQFVRQKAETIVEAAQANVRDYFVTAPTLTVDQDVGLSMDGSTAVIGIRDAGSKSRRLARAQGEGRVNWLLKALEEGGSR